MCSARWVVVFTVVIVTALGAASPAVASVEVTDEAAQDGSHCNPCPLSVDSVPNSLGVTGTLIQIMAGGMEINGLLCDDEFDAEIYEDGTGRIVNQRLHGHPATCGKKACGSTGQETTNGEEWALELSSVGANVRAEVPFCVTSLTGGDRICHLNNITVTETNHHTVLDAQHLLCEDCITESSGRWEVNGTPLEINAVAP